MIIYLFIKKQEKVMANLQQIERDFTFYFLTKSLENGNSKSTDNRANKLK